MNNDFGTQLTAMFDDVAASITPRADFAATQTGGPAVRLSPIPSSAGGSPFRRGPAIAAAALLLVTGGVAAARWQDSPDRLSTAQLTSDDSERELEEPTPSPKDPTEGSPDPASESGDSAGTKPSSGGDGWGDDPKGDDPKGDEVVTVDQSAEVVGFNSRKVVLGGTATPGQRVAVTSALGSADSVASEDGKWQVVVILDREYGDPASATTFTVGFEDGEMIELVVELPPVADLPKTEEPKVEEPKVEEPKVEEPKVEDPAPTIAFTASFAEGEIGSTSGWQRYKGTAQPGSKVWAKSEYGIAYAYAGDDGYWTLRIDLAGMPPKSDVGIKLVNSNSEVTHWFAVTTAPGEQPPTVEFSAMFSEGVVEGNPIWQRYYGTGQPGSQVTANSPYGSASATVDEKGAWTLKLWMENVPAGSVTTVTVANSASARIKQFNVETPSAPPVVGFTANAAFTECDSTPPYNEYWGTAQPGTTIIIASPYGGAERTVGESGGWEARVEFPGAPIGEKFTVKVKSVATGEVKEFFLTAVAPV